MEIHHDPVVVGRPGPDVPIRGVAEAREGVVDEDASCEEDRSPEDEEERQASGVQPGHSRNQLHSPSVEEGGRICFHDLFTHRSRPRVWCEAWRNLFQTPSTSGGSRKRAHASTGTVTAHRSDAAAQTPASCGGGSSDPAVAASVSLSPGTDAKTEATRVVSVTRRTSPSAHRTIVGRESLLGWDGMYRTVKRKEDSPGPSVSSVRVLPETSTALHGEYI